MKLSETTKKGLFGILIEAVRSLFVLIIDELSKKQTDNQTPKTL